MSELPDDGDGQDVRAFLRDVSGRVRGRDDLFDRVRAGALRRRRFTASASAALAALAVAGCGAGHAAVGHSASQPVAVAGSGDGALACPAVMPGQASLPTGHPDLSEALVPGSPARGIACVFESDQTPGASTPSVTMTRSTVLTGSELTSVVAALQQPVSAYTFRCPYAARHDTLFLEFGYSSGGDVAVEVTSPCPGLTNGSLTGAFNAQGILPAEISALLPAAAQ